jgi:hypothetical protein
VPDYDVAAPATVVRRHANGGLAGANSDVSIYTAAITEFDKPLMLPRDSEAAIAIHRLCTS